MFKKYGTKILTVLLAAVFLFSTAMAIRQQFQYRNIDTGNSEAAQIAGLSDMGSSSGSVSSAPSGTEIFSGKDMSLGGEAAGEEGLFGDAAALMNVDLEALQAVNQDIIGWIEIPGTKLSCPLVKGADNQYYLKRDWRREPSSGGAIFVEETNSPDLTDFHTIIYGHRMRNGAMFAMLKDYQDQNFWKEHPSIYVADDQGVSRYDIFSAEEAGVTSLVYRTDITENRLEEDFLKYCMQASVIDTGIVPSAEDRVLTLSTCTGRGYRSRWVVHGVLRFRYDRNQ